jgi:pyrroloquinoline quinone (PQQ) biosynthesis protein C
MVLFCGNNNDYSIWHSQMSNTMQTTPETSEYSSLDLLNTGSSGLFINTLLHEIHNHSALNHPYLVALGNGTLPDTAEALKNYAHQYSFYSSYFVKYLDGVINALELQSHKDTLFENIEEERGNPDATELIEKPHVEIFDYFKKTIGVDKEYEDNHPASTTTLLWRDLFLQKCNSTIPGVGVGAIGIATEYIVPHIYKFIAEAIENHTDYPEDASVFFRLHMECDEEHADNLIKVTTEIAEDTSTREAIRFGVISALNLRNAFWDSQYSRAFADK